MFEQASTLPGGAANGEGDGDGGPQGDQGGHVEEGEENTSAGSGGGGDGMAEIKRWPQSAQSVERRHSEYCAPSPPSSHSLSNWKMQVLEQRVVLAGGDGGGGVHAEDPVPVPDPVPAPAPAPPMTTLAAQHATASAQAHQPPAVASAEVQSPEQSQ